ncbi:MAG TPA: tyrosine-type recombinase/integrase, partial [Acidimicrobiia bacterium]
MSEPLAVLAEQWLAWKNTAKPSSATLKARRADLAALAEIIVGQLGLETTQEEDRFRRWLGALDPSHLDRETIISAFATYATSHAAASIRRCRSTWTGFCQWLVVHRQVLETNPVEFVEPPKARRWRPRPISEEDLARIVQAAQRPYEKARQPWPELEQALCALFVGAGLRVSEAISVRVGDVRRSPIELTKLFVTGKGGVTRTIPLPPEIVDVLDRYLESRKERLGPFQPTDPLILRPNGKPLT